MTPNPERARGIDPVEVGNLLARAARDVEEGTVPSCQLALAVDGELVASATAGAATADSRYVIFSVTKALIAAAVWVLMGERRLDPSTRVAEIVPEFGTNGKDAVTVEHLLVHTCGFPRAPMQPEEGGDRDRRLERFTTWRLEWEPGSRYQYHAQSAHWVLAEVIDRVSDEGDHRRVVNERVCTPLGLDGLRLGVPPTAQGDIVELRADDPISPEELGKRYGVPQLAEALGEVRHDRLLRYNEPGIREIGVPGGGAVSTAVDVALLFQELMQNRHGLWDPEILRDGTSTVRCSLPDPWTLLPANRTLGLVVAGDDRNGPIRGFGATTGPRSFGSPGVGGQVAWADPDSGLSFCYLTNGLDPDLIRAHRRGVSLSNRAAACSKGSEP